MLYAGSVPRLWNETIEAHRRDVREAILDATAGVVTRDGLLAVTMSRIATEAGIGRATLYKYFADVESILGAWHERQVSEHLSRLRRIADQEFDPLERLAAVLEAYAELCHGSRHGHDQHLAAVLHRAHGAGDPGRRQVLDLVTGLIEAAVGAGGVRTDMAAEELAEYCLHALTAAEALRSDGAVRRLVSVVMSALAVNSGATQR